MGQVTIYLDDDVEKRMVDAASAAQLSKSKWISQIIQEKVANEWPESVLILAGAWQDFPDAKEIRQDMPKDSERETF